MIEHPLKHSNQFMYVKCKVVKALFVTPYTVPPYWKSQLTLTTTRLFKFLHSCINPALLLYRFTTQFSLECHQITFTQVYFLNPQTCVTSSDWSLHWLHNQVQGCPSWHKAKFVLIPSPSFMVWVHRSVQISIIFININRIHKLLYKQITTQITFRLPKLLQQDHQLTYLYIQVMVHNKKMKQICFLHKHAVTIYTLY